GTGRGPAAGVSRHVALRHVSATSDGAGADAPELVVTGSGNLAFIYFPRQRHRLCWEEMDELYPGLVERLAAHEGVGFVVVQTASRGAVALGKTGAHFVDERRVHGDDP